MAPMPRHAWLLDLLVVLAFAAVGRASHAEGLSVPGVLGTAWPFLAGLALGWAVVLGWRGVQERWWATGLVLAACCLVGGMTLRRLTGEGTAPAFVLVAAGVLVLGLVGWRGLAATLGRGGGTRLTPKGGHVA